MKIKLIVLCFMCLCLIFLTACENSPFAPDKKADCVIVGEINVIEDYFGDIKFLGEIKNQGDGKALYVKINFTMKNASGNVIDTDFTYVSSTDLAPGQTSSFECYTSVAFDEVDSWTYEIDWTDEE